jgi:hypothetical protein
MSSNGRGVIGRLEEVTKVLKPSLRASGDLGILQGKK